MVKLDDRLAKDALHLGDLPLSSVLLLKNALYPWVILVPNVEGASEITDLTEAAQIALIGEINSVSKVMQMVYDPDKLNIASLGNHVAQLHVHVIARYHTDNAWPEPVWGTGQQPYSEQALREASEVLVNHLTKLPAFEKTKRN
jgi:diadenosine tetraphosphate (Ap4A) HIT family hydrolase